MKTNNIKKQNKWELLERSYWESRREETFRNITPQWIEFLKEDKNSKLNSFLMWIIGNRGSGKTADVLKIANILLKDNPKRVVQFWQAHQDLIENINMACPEEYIGRFETIFKLKQIKRNSIFVIDEGLLGVNAKEALKVEMRNLVKFLSKSRHYNVIGIVNSVSFSILLQFKNVVDMIMYKRLPRSLIQNKQKNDFVLKEHPNKILGLKDWQGILVSNYKRFEMQGILSWKYEDYCPWFNKNISMYQKSTSPDVAYDETTRLLRSHASIVNWTIKAIGSDFKEKNGFRNFKMWLYTNHTDVYQDNLKKLKIIHDLYLYTLSDNHHNKISSAVLSIDGWKSIDFVFKYSENDIFDKIKKNKSLKITEIKETTYKEYIKGATQKDLEFKHNISQGTISKWFKVINGGMGDERGTLFEEEYADYLESLNIYDKIDLIGDSGKPDIMCYKEDVNELHIYSCKTLKKRSHTFREKKLKQEYDTALHEEPNYKKVRLFLTVLVRSENKTYQKELNYRNPSDVHIN